MRPSAAGLPVSTSGGGRPMSRIRENAKSPTRSQMARGPRTLQDDGDVERQRRLSREKWRPAARPTRQSRLGGASACDSREPGKEAAGRVFYSDRSLLSLAISPKSLYSRLRQIEVAGGQRSARPKEFP